MATKTIRKSKPIVTTSRKTGKTVSYNPATGRRLGEFTVDSIDDVRTAVKTAKLVQPQWAGLPLKQRIKSIIKIRKYIVENLDTLAERISIDNGKTLTDALITELVSSSMAVSYYCKNAAAFLRDRKLSSGNILFANKRSRIMRIPFGVVGIISPWNYPFTIPFSEIIMALLAGNCVIFKAASETQLVGHALKECIEAAGLPEGVFTYINMPGSMVGDAFLEAGVDKLFFTGSVPVGKYLMKKASETLTPVSLELGGNDPAIIMEDADLERAAAGVTWAGFQNSGQSCGGIERVYVHKKVYSEFLSILKKKIESLRTGPGTDFDIDIGSMTTERQMRTVRSHIDDAVERGASIYTQSYVDPSLGGYFLPSTVLTGVDHSMLIMREETFGPVIGVMPFETTDEAIEYANDSHLGLTASIWTGKTKRAIEMARRIKAGAITINDHLVSHGMAETPWGGFKQSGIGRTHGDIGFAEMTQPVVVMNDIMPLVKKNFWWHPFDKTVYNGGKGVVYLLYGKNLYYRLKGLFYLLRAFPRTFRAKSR